MNPYEIVEREKMKKEIPKFNVGDTVKVYTKFKDNDKERTQAFEGIVIRRKGGGIRETFTVRHSSHGEGVERIFPLHSPIIEKIEVVREGKVRRGKLYYLRNVRGKKLKVKEKKVNK